MAVTVSAAVVPAVALLVPVPVRRQAEAGHRECRRGDRDLLVFFTHADGAALLVLPITIRTVFVTGEGRALHTAAHLAAVLVPHVAVGAGLGAGEGSTLGHGDAALAHLTAEVVSLVPHGALQRAVCGYVWAGVIAETLAEEASIFVREEAVGTFGARQSAVLQRRAQQGAHGLVGRLFTEWTALSGDLDWVLAALFAGHGGAVRLPVHTLAESAVVLFPLLLVGAELIIHPAARHGAIRRQQLHIYADGAALSLRNIEVLTVQLSALGFGAEGDATSTLTQPAGVHPVHVPLHELLPTVHALGGDFLTFIEVTAVSRLSAGLARPLCALAGGTLGFVAGAEVTGALRSDGGTAASRRREAPGQD